MTLLISLVVIHLSWLLLTFMDAICFEKVYGEDMYIVWHGAKWFATFPMYFYIVYLAGGSPWWGAYLLIALHVQHEFFYRLFRFWDVYKLDNKYRCLWMEKAIKAWWELL